VNWTNHEVQVNFSRSYQISQSEKMPSNDNDDDDNDDDDNDDDDNDDNDDDDTIKMFLENKEWDLRNFQRIVMFDWYILTLNLEWLPNKWFLFTSHKPSFQEKCLN